MTYSAKPRPSEETKLQGLANRKLYAAITSGLLLAVAGGAALKLTMAGSGPSDVATINTTAPAPSTALDKGPEPTTGVALPFQSKPFLAASTPLHLADPTLLRSTSSQTRVDNVAAGRPDPFASIVLPGPRLPRSDAAAAILVPAPPEIATQSLPTMPVAATQSLPPLPQTAVTLPTLPAPFLPGTVPPSPTSIAGASTGAAAQNLVDQVVVSGVVQVGNTVSVIVTEPGSTVSRRVSQGDMLVGGRITVKSVDMSVQEPVVVLTYDGRDYTRTVGASLVSAL